MSKNNPLRELLPREKWRSMRYLETDSSTKHRRVSLACTECQKTKSKCSAGDRRRNAHTAELLNFRVALYQMAAKLRSGTPEEILRLVREIQNLPTDQDAVNHLTDGCSCE
ncbi:hypothetical protein PENARI_c191G09200 [Penicillium arizonense]|uniref:Zn(2)-C6 fungal-type domain-containing protein n=1 Tax=Penicillium arizonense TaxID=1835702 RepID=A0A1F5L0V8_PENAI|nr:hypothetical protein PENARI_c191G09200 [Penicillium arizonense]OGE46561.1 hypothetical protein PENARI_c191G09200 [Penicillium arizonense]